MSSLDQLDLTNLTQANGFSKWGAKLGSKFGCARTTFTATGGKAIGAYSLDLTIPKGAVVKRAYYKVLTTFTSATDAGTIALKIVGANDVVSAVAISNGSNPWDAATLPVATIVTPTLSTWLVTTVDSPVTATVAVEALTAGKLVLWVEWAFFGDLSLT